MPALFTDDNGRVTLIHYLPELLEPERLDDVALVVDPLPDTPATGDDEEAVLYVVDDEAVYQIEPREFTDAEFEQYSLRLAARLAVADKVRGGLDDKTVADLSHVFPRWRTGIAVEVGEIYRWDGTLVEVIQAHTTQADWTPDLVPALFKTHGRGNRPDDINSGRGKD